MAEKYIWTLAIYLLALGGLAPGIASAQLNAEESLYLDEVVLGGSLTPGAELGDVLAFGDFDGDGHDELVIGAPSRSLGSLDEAGRVFVVPGSPDGLLPGMTQTWTANATLIPGIAQEGDRLGSALAVGDFNADGTEDLAIGIPGSSVNGLAEAGRVVVLFGSATGLGAGGSEGLDQDDLLGSGPEAGDAFGSALAAGDFNDDGSSDLAIGSPSENWNGAERAGLVQLIIGDDSGLLGNPSLFLTQGSQGVTQAGDRYGASLAAGNFAGDSADDLAIGSPGEDSDAGVVILGTGTAGTLLASIDLVASYQSDDCGFAVTPLSSFGVSLTLGNFDGDAYQDIGVGAPGSGGLPFQGIACALFGQNSAVAMRTASLFQSPAWNDVAEENDFFGFAVAAGDFNGDGYSELAVGTPGENLLGVDFGLVTVFPGDPATPLAATLPVDQITQDSPGITGVGQPQDQLGRSLAVGDFNGDQVEDLAMAIPGESQGAGAVIVLPGVSPGLIFRNGFESGSLEAWSLAVP
ncbi:MAG: hypothetical protein AAF725_09185 [Acidobacteriota bacterium]